MSSERPGGDWRQPAGGKPPINRGNATSRRAWQPGGSASPPPVRKGRSRSFRLLLAGGITAAIVGLMIVVILFFWPAHYPQLAILCPSTGESLSLPENVAGMNAANELAGWAAEGRDRPQLDQTPVVTADASGVKFAIDPNAKNLVVYVSSHGGADAAGPYLWVAPPDARSATSAYKVRVRDLLDRVADRHGKPTLLIFDTTRVTVSWPHGMLFNDFARAIKELDGEIDRIPGLTVICASDEDQRSWVVEERRGSVFGYYFLEALRGAGRNRGERVTAATAFDYAKTEVERWAIGNRGEKQTPILLPTANGRNRAEKIALAAAPGGGYESPSAEKLEPPVDVPHELEDGWKTAGQLAAQVPPPEANNPGLWREYLDTLVRWEHLFRLGANTNTVRDRVAALAGQLKNPTLGRELACQAVAIPTSRVLGRPAVSEWPRGSAQYNAFRNQVWGAASPADRVEGWAALLRSRSGQETDTRTAAANVVLTTLIEEGPTPNNLRIAADVLTTTHGTAGIPAPAEAHFVRMLQLRLDEKSRPDPSLLKQTIALRKEAEDAAWVFMTQPTEYPYTEYVFPWVRGYIGTADRNRELGQDLLFDSDPKSWQEAARYFELARADYAHARTDGRKVAAALATRDKVFARLPYYARWLAGYRGTRPQVQVDQLLDQAENAARKVHQIAELTAKDPPPLDQLDKLDGLRGEVEGHFKAVTDAFDADIATFNNTPLPSNWHALDTALSVPFIPSRRRAELLGYLRFVSHQLAINTQQPDGSRVPPPATRDIAARHGRMAIAILNDQSPDHRQLIDRPDPHAWWNSVRAAGDAIGTQFCGLAAGVKTNADQATRTATLKEAAPSLAKAATLARLIDPAAPLLPGLDPVAVDLRFRRHAMLLWHAQRTTTEGWADVAQTTPDGWYCRKVAKLLINSAQALILEDATELTTRPAENFSPSELDRWVSDCRTEASRRPIVLKLIPERDQTVADEPTWNFAFNLMVPDKDKDAVGFPVSWLDAPPAPYPQPAPGSIGRRVEPDFVRGRATATRPVKFTAIGPPADVAGSGKLISTVLYRGHLYQKPTEVVLVGTPTREWVYTPPKGPACFAIRAERSEVAGAVTILIDLTASMTTHIFPKNEATPTRLEEAKKGLQLVLKQLPRGTTVTLAYFYGDKTFKNATVKPYGVPVVMDGSNWERVYAAFKDEKAEGQSTPLAGAIREVLAKDNAKKFWPADFTTGSRTLIVLTDGEDNWEYDKKEPGQVVLDAIRNKHNNPDDVNLHIIFFGLTSEEDLEEQQRALKQFEILRRPEQFRDPPRTPGQLWPGVREAKALAELCRGAMLPQFPYSSGKQLADRLEATVPEEGVLRTTPAIEPLVYDLWGLSGPQAIQLRPADRVLFQARRRDDAFELFLPAYAYETATKANPPRPRATTGTAATGGILGTIPELTGISGSNDTGLSLAVTLEPSGERRAANLLEVTRPKFVWFDVAYEDGKPAPYVGIENRTPLWAPAWNLNLARWEPGGTALSKVRHPVVSGFWLDGFPIPDAGYPVNLNDLPGSWERLEKVRTVRVRDCDVNLLSITREEYSDPSLPKGEYLTIRMKYGKPGELVFVRPGNLKGTKQPYALYERHVYYDAQSRCTARFGPIFDTDLNKDITLDLYAVAGLREASVRSSRSVTVRFPAGELESLKMPQELTVPPRKE